MRRFVRSSLGSRYCSSGRSEGPSTRHTHRYERQRLEKGPRFCRYVQSSRLISNAYFHPIICKISVSFQNGAQKPRARGFGSGNTNFESQRQTQNTHVHLARTHTDNWTHLRKHYRRRRWKENIVTRPSHTLFHAWLFSLLTLLAPLWEILSTSRQASRKGCVKVTHYSGTSQPSAVAVEVEYAHGGPVVC